jgi:hypothetical protein
MIIHDRVSIFVSTIQTKNIAAGLIVLKFQAKIIGHNVSLTKKYSVILIYFRPLANDRWQSETLESVISSIKSPLMPSHYQILDKHTIIAIK